jgi:hypothetical protein
MMQQFECSTWWTKNLSCIICSVISVRLQTYCISNMNYAYVFQIREYDQLLGHMRGFSCQ